jgi:hypothetical protein
MHSSRQNSPHCPLVPSLTASWRSSPYRLAYAFFTFSRWVRSQWKRTRREISSSRRSPSFLEAVRAWLRSSASRAGLLMTPLRTWAMSSPCGGVESAKTHCLPPMSGEEAGRGSENLPPSWYFF